MVVKMDIRTQPSPPSTYVDTTIPKVADTPLEGTESVESKTYGPFESTGSTVDKAVNRKARFVRFLEPGEDPIEKAFDSIFLFIDDVREAGSTGRGICSGDRIDTDVAPRKDAAPASRELESREDEYARQDIIVVDDEESDGLTDDGSEPGCMTMVTQRIVSVKPTVECVTEGLCRNPCVDANMPPPVDLMLSVEETPSTQGENGAQQKPRSGRKVEFSFSKDNLMRDVSLLEDDDEPEESLFEAVKNSSDIQAVFELFVERVRELVPKVLPQECHDDADEVLRQFSDTFVVEAVVATKEASTIMVKDGVDEDPIVEAIDRLILFFDDIQPHIAGLQHRQQTYLEQLEPYYNELQPYFVELQQNIDDLQSLFTQQRDDLLKQFAALTGATESMKGANEVLQEKVKPKKKTKALQMDPREYAEALESAASLLSQYAPEEDLRKYSQEELHQRALERIMEERPESEDDIPEYKTEAMLLAQLMHGADQAIMDSRYDEKELETTKKEPVRTSHKEELIVLGHSRSATLTPIPEADEASAGTPTSEKIEEGVANGTIPEVPIFDPHPTEKEHELIPREERQEPEPEQRVAVNSEASFQDVTERMQTIEKPETREFKQKEYVENDPIVLVIDKMFLCYDDVQEEIHSDKPCNTCFGSSVPSDLADSVDDIIDRSEEAKDDDIIENETPAVSIDPRPETLGKSESSEGQYMLEQALLMVQEASKLVAAESGSFRSPDDVRIAKSSEEQLWTMDAEQPPAGYETDLVIDMMDKIALAFEDAKEKAEHLQRATLDSLISSGKDQSTKDHEIIDLVDVSYEQNDEVRKASNSSKAPPRSSSDEMTPQISMDMEQEKQQAKVEFEIPESLRHSNQESYIAWGGDDSELMASINADRKLSEIEHENIFRDVSKGLQESAGFSIFKAPAFTEGNSGSADLGGSSDEQRISSPTQAVTKALFADSIGSIGSSAEQRQEELIVSIADAK